MSEKIDTSDIPEAGPEWFTKAQMRLPCPCCKGAGKLAVYLADRLTGSPERHDCTHCMGNGWITGERVTR